MSDAQKAKSTKYIEGVSLASFLQLLEQERKSCTLVVHWGGLSGSMFFIEGRLVDAEFGQINGREAAYSILSWEKATFYLARAEERVERISESLTHLILTASARRDEKEAERAHPVKPAAKASNSGVARIAEKLTAIPCVLNYYLLNRQGKIVSQSDRNNQMGDFIAYCIVSGIQMREALGASGLHNIRIRLADDTMLLVVPAGKATIGLQVQKDTDLRELYPQLKKALKSLAGATKKTQK